MRLDPPIPVLRTFDWALARRFYVDGWVLPSTGSIVRAPTAPDMRRSRAVVTLTATDDNGATAGKTGKVEVRAK